MKVRKVRFDKILELERIIFGENVSASGTVCFLLPHFYLFFVPKDMRKVSCELLK